MRGATIKAAIYGGIPTLVGILALIFLLGSSDPIGLKEFGDRADTPIVFEWRGEQPDDLLGHTVVAGVDLDEDGVPDIVSGAAGPPHGGSVSAYSGKTGKRIWGPQVADVRGDAGFGTAVAFVDDLDGDGVPEIAAGAPGDGAGVVFLLAGADGRPLLRIDGDHLKERFGDRVVGVDDHDGDGHGDLAIAATGLEGAKLPAVIRIVSSASGALIREFGLGSPKGDRLGFAMVTIPDQDGDGLRDLVASAIGAAEHAGVVAAFSTASGEVLWRVQGERHSEELGHDLDLGGDLNGDDRPEVLASAYHAGRDSYILALDCKSGAVVRRFESGTENGLGHCVAGVGDMNGDGVPDVAAGAPNEAAFDCLDVGYVHVLSGKDGSLLGKLVGGHEDGRFGYDISGIGDLDGDGRSEIVIGSCLAHGRLGRLVVSRLR